MLWPDPAQRTRLVEIRDNLRDRTAEAEREGWLGEVEGRHISLAGADEKLAQLDRRTTAQAVVDLGTPAVSKDLTSSATALPTQRSVQTGRGGGGHKRTGVTT